MFPRLTPFVTSSPIRILISSPRWNFLVQSTQQPLRVLVVDDSLAELRLLTEAFRDAEPTVEVGTAADGYEAMRVVQNTDGLKPNLMLLDINMPGLSGHEVLERVKSSRELRQIIVLMFSSSSSDLDIQSAYDHYANGYIVKPSDLDQYFSVVQDVTKFWHGNAHVRRREWI